jgi:putative DNA primase/helicase
VTEIADDYKVLSFRMDQRIKEERAKPEFQALNKGEQKDHLRPLLAKQKAYESRAKEIKDPTRINKVLDLSSVAAPGYLGVIGKEWNQDPHLFACGNKVLDLQSGKALNPNPKFYINRASTIEWAGLHAESELWESFLGQVFNADQELIDYIQKCVGYWMTGLMTHQEFYCLWGPQGRNGKGVFFRTLRMVMGSYFQMIPSKYLLDEKSLQNTDKPDQHLVTLEHTRSAYPVEGRDDVLMPIWRTAIDFGGTRDESHMEGWSRSEEVKLLQLLVEPHYRSAAPQRQTDPEPAVSRSPLSGRVLNPNFRRF